jgi:hypothetical protein
MNEQKVFVLTIQHRHESDVGAYSTYEKAYAAVAEYCRDNWSEVSQWDFSEVQPPMDDITCINVYFELQRGSINPETFSITEVVLQ